ncbi:MAG: GNAT family N-acetyltransferase [Anaerolineales bacterium]|nr:GNAT family N-acetyltransferase [Anaerolineales bacterium]NUQ84660.1 GNAT family N-acetyltransferase [Anaerolineales bacterium]
MIEIRPIREHEIQEAKRVIFTVAYEIFGGATTLEESIAKFSAQGKLNEMDDAQKNYFENGGTFLVSVKDGRIIGTGAIRYLEDGVCELKRLWLLTEYHGQGLGYRMMQELINAARQKGYRVMRLLTDRFVQRRAIEFYKQLGFYEIPSFGDDPDDMGMEMSL